MINRKVYIIDKLCRRYLINISESNLDILIWKDLSKQYLGDINLFELYSTGQFNCHCNIASFICSLNLSIPCKLVRGELLSNINGKPFYHAWIEVTYNGVEYVIDTSLGKSIPKNIYYHALSPKVIKSIDRDDLFINIYASYLKKELTKKNDLSLEKVYSSWWKYENKWLSNISDNSLLSRKVRKICLNN